MRTTVTVLKDDKGHWHYPFSPNVDLAVQKNFLKELNNSEGEWNGLQVVYAEIITDQIGREKRRRYGVEAEVSATEVVEDTKVEVEVNEGVKKEVAEVDEDDDKVEDTTTTTTTEAGDEDKEEEDKEEDKDEDTEKDKENKSEEVKEVTEDTGIEELPPPPRRSVGRPKGSKNKLKK